MKINPSWLPEVLHQLRIIAALPVGWDSYGAAAPDATKMDFARRLIVRLCKEHPDMPRPHVNPTRDGGVQFEWEIGSHYFEIEVDGEHTVTYFFCDDDEHVEKEAAEAEKHLGSFLLPSR